MRLWRSRRTVVPVVRLQGPIGLSAPLRPGLSLASVAEGLKKAFSYKAPAVAIVVNSPGGSPAQSSLIFSRIRALAQESEKQVLVFVEDVAASGGYWLAVAGDEIFADRTSIVGSIGVVTATFGFPDLMERLGVERRVYTVGENKAILDPFRPERETDVAILHAVQEDVQRAFVSAVKTRRGTRLADHPDLFSGRFWAGASAVELGLVDGIGELRATLRERFGPHLTLREVVLSRRPFWRARFGIGAGAGLDPEGLLGAVRADRMWDRYGL